ncbi:DNA mismatch repair protein MutL [Actinoplanes sp. NPDC051494]|uniref:DNA mismatch repair protein MutL n=1 Tax=Actinoplanes sp. NPDC051494 TaxID=3363907 RepID=UPI003797A374
MRSSRSWIPVLGWCAATLTSIALASVAMLPVLRTATADTGTLMSVDQLRDSDSGNAGGSGTEPTPEPSPEPPKEERSPQATTTTTTPKKSPSKSRTPSRTPSSVPPTTTTAPTTKAPATTTEDGWTVSTDGDGTRTYVRSFRVEGGQTVIRASAGVIKLVTATPADGFSVATVQDTPDNLAVYFNETNHSFIIHVVWQADKPFAQVNEVG